MHVSKLLWRLAALIFVCVIPKSTPAMARLLEAGQKPCELSDAIIMPREGKCVVPLISAYNWSRAQDICELARGTVYRIPLSYQVTERELFNCLMSFSRPPLSSLWVNTVATLLPQFRWLNGTTLHQIEYCPPERPVAVREEGGPTSTALQLDTCILYCHGVNASYTYMVTKRTSSKCYCVHDLNTTDTGPCDTSTFSYTNMTHYFTAPTSEKPLLEVHPGLSQYSGQPLCGSVDKDAIEDLQLKTVPCSSRRPFLCDIGNSTDCPEQKLCNSVNCVFHWHGTCLRRVDYPLDWLEAHAFCNTSGGALWQMDSLPALQGLDQHVTPRGSYWIGLSNFLLQNKTDSTSLHRFSANFQRVKCGSLQLVQYRSGSVWEWDSGPCDQQRPILCQFAMDNAANTADDPSDDVICPWTLGPTHPPLVVPFPTPVKVKNTDSFPIAALIAGLVAGIVVLVCLTACCACCCCRKKKNKKNEMEITFVPYVEETGTTPPVDRDATDNVSNKFCVRTSADSQSQTACASHTPNDATAAYATVHQAENASESRDQSPQDLKETSFISYPTSTTDESNSLYSRVIKKPRDVMTLEGKMDIKDEAANEDSASPDKPEVTLVTDQVDMNFTVNAHSTTDGQADTDQHSLDRTLEEIQVPVSEGSTTLTLPERVVEAGSVGAGTNV